MENTLYVILVAGIPASGKTTFAKYLSEKLSIPLICKDSIKETIWDRIHYDTKVRDNSRLYGALAYDLSFSFADELLKSDVPFIFESNFTNDSAKYIIEILKRSKNMCKVKVVTVLFDADTKVLHKRFIERDNLPERHPGLVSNAFFSDYEVFRQAVEPLREFSVGDRIIVDTTDFKNVNYDEIEKKIRAYINKSLP